MTNPNIAHPPFGTLSSEDGTGLATMPPSSAHAAAKGFRRSLWEIQKSGLGDRGDSRIFPASFALPQQSLRNSP